MAILDGTDIVYVERCRSSRAGQSEIDLNLHVGARLPAYCTSMGKVLLAFQAPAAQADLIDRSELVSRGPRTLTSRAALEAELARVRERGIAANDEELAWGLRSIAAPIRGADGSVVAALNLAAHQSMDAPSIEVVIARLGNALVRTAHAISVRVGYRGGA
jgi:IclR family pca regulon transcriptional regulator